MYNDENMNLVENNETSENANENVNMNQQESAVQVNTFTDNYSNDINSVNNMNNANIPPQWQPDSRNYNYMPYGEINQTPKRKKEKKPVTMGKVVAACAVTLAATVVINALVTSFAMKGILDESYVKKSDMSKYNVESTSDALINSVGSKDEVAKDLATTEQIVDAVMPSVVAITSTSIVDDYSFNPFFGGGSYQVSGAGSGIIIGMNDTELLIVTNNHVVEDTTSLSIKFCNDTSIDGAYIKGTDSSNDLAVVAVALDTVDKGTMESIKIATLGDSDELKVGENVIAIGNALGYGQSVTKGVISAINREIELESGTLTVIQTDAAINGGNSGGALVNTAGQVIGINVAKTSSSSMSETSVEGMGYAIPVSQVEDIIDELMNKETRFPVDEKDKGYLGLSYDTVLVVDDTTSEMYRIPKGIYLREVEEDSLLGKAGVSEGAVITEVNGESIETWEDLIEEMSYHKAGEKVTLTIQTMGEGQYVESTCDVRLMSYDEVNEN